ncbi:hypothetical protein IscW_ISCW008880 [Ixodes scapularis]|uniref:Uncharacterized protein n=1 Tax=Ixodes scapularis TaxID=6945 RepID=B7Q0A1_IXOSC|nr:hypothetical protein IscW_ISCW008880 [Ixodes scapularis]|eukprot:XP_002407355.1 hypothetical protein IscW_ISCW008880 [Ixodes scapularis]
MRASNLERVKRRSVLRRRRETCPKLRLRLVDPLWRGSPGPVCLCPSEESS